MMRRRHYGRWARLVLLLGASTALKVFVTEEWAIIFRRKTSEYSTFHAGARLAYHFEARHPALIPSSCIAHHQAPHCSTRRQPSFCKQRSVAFRIMSWLPC